MGKIGLMAGTAAIAMFAASGASAAANNGAATDASQPSGMIQLAQADMPPSNVDLEARISALESEVQDSEMRAAQAANAPPPPMPTGWWSNTSISGRMYFDTSNITHTSNGSKTPLNGASPAPIADNGFNFDIKRFYVGIDHTFDPIFSANITTDVTYDATTAASQIFIKKAYLQAKIDPAFTIRAGSADLPWVPYLESLYGYRYVELTMIDRTKFGTSADWGVHALGTLFDGIINYDFAAINGGGYKKAPIGAGTNRFKSFDYEGRVSAVYDGFNLGVGGYTGKLGQPFGAATPHTANRFDVVGAYVANGIRVGVEYFNANDWNSVTKVTSDQAHGISTFASYQVTPEWGVFGKFENVQPNTKIALPVNDNYFNVGISYSPVKIVDISLVYKHESTEQGNINTSNGVIGQTVGAFTPASRGAYSEIGLFGDLQW
jgi:hypothetical protein